MGSRNKETFLRFLPPWDRLPAIILLSLLFVFACVANVVRPPPRVEYVCRWQECAVSGDNRLECPADWHSGTNAEFVRSVEQRKAGALRYACGPQATKGLGPTH